MNERLQRLILVAVAAAITATLTLKSHGVPHLDTVAFLPEGTAVAGTKTIGIHGSIVNPGIYRLDRTTELETVIIMTLPEKRIHYRNFSPADYDIHSGDILQITQIDANNAEITKKTMNITEKMILGISLDPNQLTVAEWEKLPGIGRITAEKIIVDRQINGDFSSVYALKRVAGIGEVKIKRLAPFFK